MAIKLCSVFTTKLCSLNVFFFFLYFFISKVDHQKRNNSICIAKIWRNMVKFICTKRHYPRSISSTIFIVIKHIRLGVPADLGNLRRGASRFPEKKMFMFFYIFYWYDAIGKGNNHSNSIKRIPSLGKVQSTMMRVAPC